jgi:hypothetical protein
VTAQPPFNLVLPINESAMLPQPVLRSTQQLTSVPAK